jgi:outer membrane immunogenic protein
VGDGQFLPYLVGGIEAAEFEYQDQLNAPGFTQALRDESTLIGAVLGGGMQFALTNDVSMGAEYLHTEFANSSVVGTVNGNNGAPFSNNQVDTHSLRTDAVRAVVNYKIGD